MIASGDMNKERDAEQNLTTLLSSKDGRLLNDIATAVGSNQIHEAIEQIPVYPGNH
jgi:hypothetical protein